MSSEVLTCPKCEALITQNTVKCRQCGQYLAGSQAESAITSVLPNNICPANFILMTLSALAFLFTAIGPDGFSFFNPHPGKMLQVGTLSVAHVFHGEWWRLILSNFIHFGLLHFGFNMWASRDLFQISNSFYKFQRSFIIFFVSGSLTFVAYYYIALLAPALGARGLAAGASAGLCGLMGAVVSGARNFDLSAQALKQGVTKWFIQIIIFGLIVLPLWSTGLHLLGFGFGYLLGFVISPDQKSVQTKQFYSYLFLACLALIAFSIFKQFTSSLLAT